MDQGFDVYKKQLLLNICKYLNPLIFILKIDKITDDTRLIGV